MKSILHLRGEEKDKPEQGFKEVDNLVEKALHSYLDSAFVTYFK